MRYVYLSACNYKVLDKATPIHITGTWILFSDVYVNEKITLCLVNIDGQ